MATLKQRIAALYAFILAALDSLERRVTAVVVLVLPMKLVRNKRGVAALVIALVVTLVALSVLIPIGLLLTANIKTTVDAMDLGTAGNATRDTLFTNIFSAYDLATIVPIIAAAGVIISIIIAAFYFRSRKG